MIPLNIATLLLARPFRPAEIKRVGIGENDKLVCPRALCNNPRCLPDKFREGLYAQSASYLIFYRGVKAAKDSDKSYSTSTCDKLSQKRRVMAADRRLQARTRHGPFPFGL